MEKDVKKNVQSWLTDYDEVQLSKARIGVLNAAAPWAEKEEPNYDDR